jgi:RNA polymerase sigma-70 factor (ECF subfamily)
MSGNPAPVLEQLTDDELMERVRDANDVIAFQLLVERVRAELLRYLRHYLHRADAADDVLQIVLFRLYRRRDQFQPGRRLRPWLYSIATHSAIDWLRSETRMHEISAHQGSALSDDTFETAEDRLLDRVAIDRFRHAASETEELRTQLRRSIRTLPDRLRSVVVLVCLLGMKQRDAAETLDIPVGTIKSRLHEAVRILRANLTAGDVPHDERS